VEAQQVLENQRAALEDLQQVVQREEQLADEARPWIGSRGPDLLRDMATTSVKNERIKALLDRHGYHVQIAPASKPAP
jgi:hypothetical protein